MSVWRWLAILTALPLTAEESPWSFSFEIRSRLESRSGQSFGKEPSRFADYVRTRAGVAWKPAAWVRFAVLGQDARAPGYGDNAPGSARDPLDLQEAYVELSPAAGPGVTFGRQMVQYGDARLLGSPQWGYTARTYDTGRVFYRVPRGRLEVLMLSPVKTRGDAWNKPVLGDRIWGTYNAFENVGRLSVLDLYALRHDQNAAGGFSGPGALRTNTFGSRAAVDSHSLKLTWEVAVQNGRVADRPHRAAAAAVGAARRIAAWVRPLELSVEYKYASGTGDHRRSGTFDQLYPAGHDKLGHMDLLGWRNLHNAKAVAAVAVTKRCTLSLMYNSAWLASTEDALYNLQGKPIARRPGAGRHAGQEVDVFGAYKTSHFLLGAGYGHFFAGGFIRHATPGLSPTYLYLTQTFSY